MSPPGSAAKDLTGCSDATTPHARVTATLCPSKPPQSCALPTESVTSTEAAFCKSDWPPHGSLPGAHRPHVAASSLAAHQQRSAPQQWPFPGCPAPTSSSGVQQAQHASSACSGTSTAPMPYQAYRAALCPPDGPEPSRPGTKTVLFRVLNCSVCPPSPADAFS